MVHGHALIRHDLTNIGINVILGLANGSIWALIAIGYTLVYGIIELINFAHGDVFMIGSFVGVGFAATLGLGLGTGTVPPDPRAARDPDHLHAGVRLAQRPDRAGGLPAPAQCAQAGPADHGHRDLVHPPERRPALAGRRRPERR